ncbi:uncharacterized protein PFL1_01727 [Pseudozyma flocculosa PF-1]|uniref:Glyoxalase-like domain-containing protein n=1 Tax=Pseudozyma flocculosa TaxID=84751 RepID=A0A5C3F057_9BASI|nr:uncharacterized protein PFL1_01727 [Pseudozyma flocculosa PF-1]EPQ30829.1 hypothetical protein PFL1_01727 [Pseudozyma flocculosa PF-1]SPO36799.1 uncharacterized protein PSFLO_02270 [Pseudozyma flocculosa]
MADHTDPDQIPHLDHLILLLNDPYTASTQSTEQLDEAIAIFSNLGFIVVRGGRHADDLTSNALLVLPDGVYIELIQFDKGPPPESTESQADYEARRKKHWWYHSKAGWIDWSLLGGVEDGRIAAINVAAEEHRRGLLNLVRGAEAVGEEREKRNLSAAAVTLPTLRYDAPQRGGRKTLDGKQLGWHVTFPSPRGTKEQATGLEVGCKRNSVPFYCEDLNPREWRVPSLHSSHPNQSTGVSSITLLYSHERSAIAFKDLALSTSLPLDLASLSDASHQDLTVARPPNLVLRAPADAEPGSGPNELRQGCAAVSRKHRIKVHVKVADDPEERDWIKRHGEGLYEVELYVSAAKLPSSAPPDGVEHTTLDAGYGRLRLHPVMR